MPSSTGIQVKAEKNCSRAPTSLSRTPASSSKRTISLETTGSSSSRRRRRSSVAAWAPRRWSTATLVSSNFTRDPAGPGAHPGRRGARPVVLATQAPATERPGTHLQGTESLGFRLLTERGPHGPANQLGSGRCPGSLGHPVQQFEFVVAEVDLRPPHDITIHLVVSHLEWTSMPAPLVELLVNPTVTAPT